MLPSHARRAQLPPVLVARALELLAENTPESRLAAAQLLAHGYELDEAQRRAELAPEDRPPEEIPEEQEEEPR